MKTRKQAAYEYAIDNSFIVKETIIYNAFIAGTEFAQRWIPIEDELPEQLFEDCDQENGNMLHFYKKYLVKGYYKNEGKKEDILLAVYKPCSSYWYFLVCKGPNTFDFIITHWRHIEYK